MKNLTEQEKKYIDEMLDLQRQKYLTTSYKRRGDLSRALKKRESQWYQYLENRKGASNAKLS